MRKPKKKIIEKAEQIQIEQPEPIQIEQQSNSKIFNILPFIIIIAFAFGLYINTIQNDYALDDAIVITSNKFTQQGLKGIKDIFTSEYLGGMYGKQMTMYSGGRYRPLSIATFAIEYQFLGVNPGVSHFINVLLYVLTCVILYIILKKIFSQKIPPQSKWYLDFSFIVVFIFAIHPIHTEVVTNIKGRDEIMSLLGSLLSLWFCLKYLENNKISHLFFVFLFFLMGIFSKESAIIFLFIIPLTIHYFTNQKLKKSLMAILPICIAAGIFIIIRQEIIGQTTLKVQDTLMTDPFINTTFSQKYGTIFYTLAIYLKLLIVPHPLTFDYYPYHIPLINLFDFRCILPFLIYSGLGLLAIIGIIKKEIYSYGIWFYLISLSIYSNIFFTIGVFMNERFTYIASIGFLITVLFFLLNYFPEILKHRYKIHLSQYYHSLTGIFIILLILYSYKTISRNTDWKDNYTLFTTDVKTSSNSLKSTAAAGEKLLTRARKEKDPQLKKDFYKLVIQYFTKTVEIFPEYIYVLVYLGEAHYEYDRNYDKSFEYFFRVLKIRPDYEKVYTEVALIMKDSLPLDYKIKIWEQINAINPNRYEVNTSLGTLYGAFKNDIDKAIYYLERANQLKPDQFQTMSDLGVAYCIVGKNNKGIETFEALLKIHPKNKMVLQNLGFAYDQLGDKKKAQYYLDLAKK
jgi:tetratricopeptide (TPR) repeat protein